MGKKKVKVNYTRAEAEEKARELNSRLTAYDFRPNCFVLLQDEEGSLTLRRSAFLLTLHPYLLLFSEHHPSEVHHGDELERIEQFVLRDGPPSEYEKFALDPRGEQWRKKQTKGKQ